MRLAKIKLAGFKSFVEPTVIPVTHDLVGIVGPNGCGKSNIIDAVRWVLGESKASALRGESMQDVIFSGSANRKAVGRASVELVFDNSSGSANGQWSSYAEIAIKRIIQRDGNSNYYINNIHVRRRDIADLFLGTGVGGRGYAIIEQGMISRIIEAKPQDLKIFLEEAAGISKYRERRHETALRLTDTRKNLVRIEDISNELTKQIERLENQAKVANEYLTLNKQLQETQQVSWLQHKIEATKQRVATEEEIKSLEESLDAETTQLQLNKTHREEARVHEHRLSEELHATQGQFYGANAEKAGIEQEIIQFQKSRERIRYLIQDIEKQLTRNQQQIDTAMDNLQHWRAEKENAQNAYESGMLRNRLENAKLPELETNFHQCEKTCEANLQQLARTEQASSLAKTHSLHATKTIQQLESRSSRLKQEYNSLPASDHETVAKIQSQLESTETQLTDIQETLTRAELAFSQESSRKDQTASQVQESQKQLSNLQAQFRALQNLQQKIENNDALKQWLENKALTSLPRLWHHIQIEKDWENALESVLQERLNSFGFPQLEAINDWKDDLPPGKLSLYEFQNNKDITRETNHQHISNKPIERRMLASFLTCSSPDILQVLSKWLRNIYVIDNIHEGLRHRHQFMSDEMFVTREGHTLTCNSIYFHSPDSHLHGVLSRQRELKQIQADTSLIEKQLETQKSDLEHITANHTKLHQTIQSCRTDEQRFIQQQHHLQLEKIKLSQINEQVEHRRHLIDTELVDINRLLVSENLQKEQAEKESRIHHEKIAQIKEHLQIAKNELATSRQSLADQHAKIQNSHKEIQEATFNEKICQNKISDIENSIKALEENKAYLTTKHESLLSENQNQDDTVLKSRLDACIQQCKHLEHKVTENRNELEKARHQIIEIENRIMTSEQKQAKLRESISQLYLKKQAASLSEDRYHEQLSDAQADETRLLSLVNHKNIAVLQSEINRINKKINALGSVNLAALDELEETRQRETTLHAQIQDLTEAIVILENAIEQIDQETKKRLQKTFNAVNNNLNETFPIIFSGGKAELVLSDGKILESGLMLTAQPPGKKNNSIHLLSGGEKALTALALIFSLFRLNPAPFCLLDEVDAPLDDSNTGRFCELVKKLSQQTQFLFISHNKITMEIAQQLVGITMQEQGVSKVVAVDIATVVNLNDTTDTTTLS